MNNRARRRCLRTTMAAVLLAALCWPAAGQAQDIGWRMRLGAGVLLPLDRTATPDPATTVRVSPTTVVVLDFGVAVKCCVELFLSGTIVPAMSTQVITDGVPTSTGSIAPHGLQAGFRYRWWRGAHSSIWGGLLIGSFSKDQTDLIPSGPAAGQTIGFASRLGIGGSISYRRMINESLSLDADVRWQAMRAIVGGTGRSSWNPFTISGGLVVRLWNRN